MTPEDSRLPDGHCKVCGAERVWLARENHIPGARMEQVQDHKKLGVSN